MNLKIQRDYLRFVIVGHVDHGKSTLIGRLLLETKSLPKGKIAEIKKISREFGKDMELAFLTDQLKEERENQMTLDTAQIFFRNRNRDYAIIDSPGHVELIKNMITGASQAEAAVLIIDAHEGIMEQTTRHASIISLMGISRLVVVLNKMDLLNYEEKPFEDIKKEVLKFLDSLKIKPAAIIPISAKDGINVSRRSPLTRWYSGPSLLEALDSLRLKTQNARKPLRFPVQDIYDIDGEKVIVGRVSSGVIKEGQKIALLPSSAETRISAVRVFGKILKKAEAGENVGITIARPLPVSRGDVIVEKEVIPALTDYFTAEVFWMAREPLESGKSMNFRSATQETECIVEKVEKRIDSSTLEVIEENCRMLKTNEIGIVRLKTSKPIVVEKFDFIEELGRFVLERNSNLEGAGIVI